MADCIWTVDEIDDRVNAVWAARSARSTRIDPRVPHQYEERAIRVGDRQVADRRRLTEISEQRMRHVFALAGLSSDLMQNPRALVGSPLRQRIRACDAGTAAPGPDALASAIGQPSQPRSSPDPRRRASRREGVRVAWQDAVELATRADAELGEDLAQVVLDRA